jgi:hypothetical protein
MFQVRYVSLPTKVINEQSNTELPDLFQGSIFGPGGVRITHISWALFSRIIYLNPPPLYVIRYCGRTPSDVYGFGSSRLLNL